MRALIAAAGLLVLLAGWAQARCAGNDLFAELERTDPAAAGALLAAGRAVPYGEGRFWRIDRPGGKPSYLFGTFHVSDAVEGVPDSVWQALDGARVSIFEVTLDEEDEMERRMATDPGFVMDPGAPTFASRMTAGDLELVAKAFSRRGIGLEVAEKLRPWMQISLIAFPPCQLEDVRSGARMLDVVLAERAVSRGIPELGLERAADSLERLSTMPLDDQTRLIVAAGRSAPFEEDLYMTNLAFYHAGRIALIELFNDWMAERHMPDLGLAEVNDRLMSDLLDGRNALWMPRLLAEVEKGNAFIAVGALHLTGEAGLIAGLVRAGFTASRLD